MKRLESKTIKRIILVLQIFLVVGLLAFSFREESLMLFVTSDDCEYFNDGYYTEAVFLPKRDVYKVSVKLDSHKEGTVVSSVCTPIASEKRVLFADDVVIFQGQESIDYRFWTIGASVVQGKMHFDSGDEAAFEISIYRTYLVYRIVSFCLFVLFLIVDSLFTLRNRATAKCMAVVFSLLLITGICYAPYFKDGIFFGADTIFHLQRIKGLEESLKSGSSIPVLNQSYVHYDHGSINCSFYSDFFLYIPVVFSFIGFPATFSYKAFLLLVIFGGAFLSYYSMRRVTEDVFASICGTALFTLTPYHLFNFYDRGAVGEYTAQAFLPLVCCGFILLLKENTTTEGYKKHKWWIIAGMTGIINSHLLTAEMMSLLIAVVCLIFAKRFFRKRTMREFINCVVICAAINMRTLVSAITVLAKGRYNLSTAFGISIDESGVGFEKLFSADFQTRPSLLIYVILFVCAVLLFDKEFRKNIDYWIVISFAFLTIFTVFMGTSAFPWEKIELIPYLRAAVTAIQFPWRFYSICSCFSGFLCAYIVLFLRGRAKKGLFIVATVCGMALLCETLVYFQNAGTNLSRGIVYTSENFGTTNSWSRNSLPEGMESSDLFYHGPIVEKEIEMSEYKKRGTTVSFLATNNDTVSHYVEVPLTAFYGYDLSQSDFYDNEISYTRGNHNDIRISIPPKYSGKILLKYTGGLAVIVSKYVSFGSVLALLIYCFIERRYIFCVSSRKIE